MSRNWVISRTVSVVLACSRVIEGRIYGGMHYRTSVVHGDVMANKVANWVAKHYFEPINKKDKD
jgi:hypothetical protein